MGILPEWVYERNVLAIFFCHIIFSFPFCPLALSLPAFSSLTVFHGHDEASEAERREESVLGFRRRRSARPCQSISIAAPPVHANYRFPYGPRSVGTAHGTGFRPGPVIDGPPAWPETPGNA